MKKNNIFILLLFLLLPLMHRGSEYIDFNRHWKFYAGDQEHAFEADFDDSEWRTVDLPHDWAIEQNFDALLPANTGKLPWRGVGWYRNEFRLDAKNLGKKIYILFDGVMAFPEVYINGQLVGKWDYGYNSFYLDITGYIDYIGRNTIAVKVDTRKFDSRWYPGAGIYRKVSLIVAPRVHFQQWGTQVLTPVVNDDSALIHLYTTVLNESGEKKTVRLHNRIVDQNGNLIAENYSEKSFEAGGENTFDLWLTIPNPERWDVDRPYLYQLHSRLETGDGIVDEQTNKFGVRTILFTADHGFWLNGRRVQLKGVNLHHDQGPLGAKFYKRAMERQLTIMKGMGVNAIRNSHNVAAPEVLDLCDSLGILLFDEIFDKWDAKAGYLPGMDFEEFAARNVRNWVMRDRNHPCVFIWSVGNEMGDIQYNINGGFEKLNFMISQVTKYDNTRPVTMVCDADGSAIWRHFDYYDVHAWNYGRRYLPARNMDTTKSVIISESSSTVSTRGFYELPLPANKTDFTHALQVSSYDLNAPKWAEVADDDFMWQEEDTYVAGEFVWTGFDYLGEPTPYNDEAVKTGFITQEESARSSYFGIVDLCGIPKDRYYLYKSHWKPGETTVHILPHWNWPGREGQRIPVFVYTSGDCAELFVNGSSQGKQCKKPGSAKSIERYRLIWPDVVYQPGEVKAVAYKNGKILGENSVETTGNPVRIRMTPDRDLLKADGNDLSYVLVEALDKKGNVCPLADELIRFEIDGPAAIEGIGNGNPQSLEPFVSNRHHLFNGKAMVIVKSLYDAGTIRLKASSENLRSTSIDIKSHK